jgi:hypothetical protein
LLQEIDYISSDHVASTVQYVYSCLVCMALTFFEKTKFGFLIEHARCLKLC